MDKKNIFNKEDMWRVWWASATKVFSFTPIDKEYEKRCFERVYQMILKEKGINY